MYGLEHVSTLERSGDLHLWSLVMGNLSEHQQPLAARICHQPDMFASCPSPL